MLSGTLWLGGGTGSGKTTVAHLLAARHGLRLFAVDAYWYAYDARLREPSLAADEQWLEQTPAEQAAQFEQTSRRRIPLVLEDLAGLPPEPPTLVEGPQVLPDLVPAGAPAVFLVATAAFQRAQLEQRPMPPTSKPARALENRIEKDRLYGALVAELARGHGHAVVEVDGARAPEEIAAEVERVFAPVLERPREPVDLRPVRRWQNDAVAFNVRAWLDSAQRPARPPEAVTFACECGARGCDAVVRLPLDEFSVSERVVAPGH